MSYDELQKWCEDNCNPSGYRSNHSANGLDWYVAEMSDGWFALFSYNRETGRYCPSLQAADLPHALSHITLCEAVTVPVEVLC